MKKLLLLAVAAVAGFNANAQYSGALNISGGGSTPVTPYQIKNSEYEPSAKSSIAGGRWYDHLDAIATLSGSTVLQRYICPIWYDSTIKQNFIDGLHPINYISFSQIIDPIHFTLYNNPDVYDPNDIAIRPETNYKVDSIEFFAAYVENLNRPETVVDTMIFSVAPTPYSYYYGINPDDAWAANYVGIGDTVKGFSVIEGQVDVPNRTSNLAGVQVWKVPLDTSLREPDSAGLVTVRRFVFPVMVNGVAGSVDIPAGRGVAITATFKSGDVHNPADTVYQYHHMSMSSWEMLGAGTYMPYYHLTHRDRNSSALMFYDFEEAYLPTILIEATNDADFRYEFHQMAAHILCDDCQTVQEFSSVSDVNSVITADVTAYPNPANNEVSVSFALNQNTNASVSISNAVGQVIATQNVSVKANQDNVVNFSTANLASGIYFYTVEAKGQRTTNRFVVTH